MPIANFTVRSGINIGTSSISETTGDFNTSGNITVGDITINGVTNDITTATIHTNNVVTGNIVTSNLVIGSQSVTTLANVASTGSYNDLTDKPAEFSRVATTSVTGLVQVGGNLSINSGIISLSSANVTSALGFTPVNSSIVGQASGLATLDSNGKLPLTQLDSTVVGSLNYQGSWNANTNSPAIIPSTGTKGYYYVVSDAGTTSIDGNNNWTVGDIIAFNGTKWNQIQGAASDVVSVAGKVGAVTLTSSDVGLGNVTNVAQLASTQTLAITGDVTASATSLSGGSITTTLSNTSVTAGTYNNVATAITPFTVDAKGRITNTGTAINVTPAWSSISSKPTTLSGFGITDGQATLVSGTNIKTVNSNSLLGSGDITIGTSGASITNVVIAIGMTTLTSTPTLLKITPASYGVAVTLPDATTCSVGGPLHIIDNKGAYPVRVLNSAGTLLGFIFAGVVSHVSLIDNSSAAGVWTVENSELVGASAQLLTTSFASIASCVDLGSSRELLLGMGTDGKAYVVVYNRSTNAFGTAVLVRSTAINLVGLMTCIVASTDLVLCLTVPQGAATFEAVTLSISGTTITVNTAATATLSANISAFADGCGLIAVGSSFVTSYTVATPAAQIRALSISGTTGGLIVAASSTIVIAVSGNATVLTTTPYTVSGSTLSAGTGSTTGSLNTKTVSKLFASGSRWCVLFLNGGSDLYGGIISLSGTTTTVSAVFLEMGPGNIADAMLVSSSKVIVLGTATTNNANILTDTAGTASAGTAITLDGGTLKAALYASGTDVYVGSLATNVFTHKVDCSGASAVLTSSQNVGTNSPNAQSFITASNAVLSRTPQNAYGTSFAQSLIVSAAAQVQLPRVQNGILSAVSRNKYSYAGANTSVSGTAYRGKSESERWASDGSTVITKLECVA